jgi:hypothetical protein
MSKGATRNPDRRREIRQVELPPALTRHVEPGTRGFRMGACRILLSRQKVGWHMSISHPTRLPTWEEVRDARYELIPDEVTMALLLPPRDEYVNVHEFCLQLYQVPADYVLQKDTL